MGQDQYSKLFFSIWLCLIFFYFLFYLFYVFSLFTTFTVNLSIIAMVCTIYIISLLHICLISNFFSYVVDFFYPKFLYQTTATSLPLFH